MIQRTNRKNKNLNQKKLEQKIGLMRMRTASKTTCINLSKKAMIQILERKK